MIKFTFIIAKHFFDENSKETIEIKNRSVRRVNLSSARDYITTKFGGNGVEVELKTLTKI